MNANTAVTSDHHQYPQRLLTTLGSTAPRTLYTWGNLDLLSRATIAFCGSRNVSEKGLQVTADTVQQLVELECVIVSGHARGVDITAHRTALEQGGCTIIVAAEGILSFKLKQELKQFAAADRLLIVSEFKPNARWTVGNAMTRNKTIVGLSDAMVLIESRMEGGTFDAGQTALKLKVPLFVAQYEMATESNTGNTHFIERGAVPILKSAQSGRANIGGLQNTLSKRKPIVSAMQEQPILFEV